MPDIVLQGTGSHNLDRSGAGADSPLLAQQDSSWNLAVQASLPVFDGGLRKAELSRARHGLRQLMSRRAALEEGVEARMRAALHKVGGSHPAIELSQDAARAAASNLELVTDAYSQGAVSVTDLVDAQNAALAAELAAAEAEYVFLIDLVEILRASGNFDLILDAQSARQWFDRVDSYFRSRGVEPLRR